MSVFVLSKTSVALFLLNTLFSCQQRAFPLGQGQNSSEHFFKNVNNDKNLASKNCFPLSVERSQICSNYLAISPRIYVSHRDLLQSQRQDKGGETDS